MRSSPTLAGLRVTQVPLGDAVERWKRDALLGLERGARKRAAATLRFRVTPGFLLLCASVGSAHGISGSAILACALASVLATHELPRALLAKRWGLSCTASLSAFGGILDHGVAPLRAGPALLLATVGALANAMMGAALFVLERHVGAAAETHLGALSAAHWIWGGLSLLPLAPFDIGGFLAERAAPVRRLGFAVASAIAVIVATAAVLSQPATPIVIAIGMLAILAAARAVVEAFRHTSDARSNVSELADRAILELSHGSPAAAMELARKGLAIALSGQERARLNRSLAWAAIVQGDPLTAHCAVSALPSDGRDVHLVASYLTTCNRVDEAIALLEDARRAGHRSRETTKLLVDVLFRKGDREGVRGLADSDGALLSNEDREAIDVALATT